MPSTFRSSAPLAVIIMGVSGSGKSTVGAALAGAIDAPFLEGDAFHAPDAIAKMAAAEPLTDQDRWPWLDRVGQALDIAVRERGRAVATCSALRRSYRDRLRATVAAPLRFVLLAAVPEELLRRLSHRPGHYMPASLLSSQLDTLELPQSDEHVLTLDAALAPGALCAEIIAWLARDPSD